MFATDNAKISTVAVIGAGIIGAATALTLSDKRYKVTLFDRDEIGAGTSSGNAGGIVEGAVVPTATPGVIRALPGYLFDRHGAAVLRPAYIFQIIPWFARFLAASRPAEVQRISAALLPLVSNAMRAHKALALASNAQDKIQPVGWLKVYQSEAGFAKSAYDRGLMTQHGAKFSILTASEVADLEPQLLKSPEMRGVFQAGSGFVNFPRGLAQAYFAGAVARGAAFYQREVLALQTASDGAIDVRTAQGVQRFDSVVVAAGAWSKKFVTQLGDRVSLDTERGYHISLATQGVSLLNRPVGFPEKDCVLSPMHDGITLVSGDELAGLKAPPDYRRIRSLLPFVKDVLPGARDLKVQREWMGFRPSTPDSLPVIGRSPKNRRVFYAFGHGHLGLTLSAITAQLIAAMVSGEKELFDTQPYQISRFN
jgi:D-amino-acid dehydrogenase